MKKYLEVILGVLLMFLLLGCESKVAEIDYNKTTWLEIKGFKTKGYDVSMSVGYGGEGKECKFFSVGLGHDVSKSTHMQIDANISNDDLHYTLRYPLNFKQGKCEFWAGGIEIRMEEYNDLDVKKYPKNMTIRATKILDRKVLVLSLTYQKEIYKDNFNLYPLNLYCQRAIHYSDLYDDGTDEKKAVFAVICHNTTSTQQMNGLWAEYQVDFLKEHNPLKVNLLISEDLKCSRTCSESEMKKAKSLGVTEKMVEIYKKTYPTIHIIDEFFLPSEELFQNFKNKHKIKE